MIEWLWPWAAVLIPLPILARWLMPEASHGSGAIRVPFFEMLTSLSTQSSGRSRRKLLLMIVAALAWLLLVAAIARPTWVGDAVTLPQSGRDLMLAIDISGSMRQDDMQVGKRYVSRLEAVKAVVGDFARQRRGDRLGLILFGEQGYLQTPLTFDRDTVRIQLSEALPGFAGNSTAIGDAIGMSVATLRERPQSSRLLILLTDGANTAGSDPRMATDIAVEAGIRIHTIGVGADSVMERNIFGQVRESFPSRDLDEELLKDIARRTGGEFFRARDPKSMAQIYEEINKLEPVPEESTYRPIRSLSHLPFTGSLALMSLLLLVRGRMTGVS